jgi:hypothetical protein
MVCWTRAAAIPMEFAFGFGYRQIIDAGMAASVQALS